MRYAELHCLSNFSFLEGASHPSELVKRAAELGYYALAITDRNSLAGVVRAHAAAKDAGIKLIIGAEMSPIDAPPVILWATDRADYARLCRLITRGRRRASKGECKLTLADVFEHSEGLLAGVLWSDEEGYEQAVLQDYGHVFRDRCYLLGELHRGPDDQRWLERLALLSKRVGLPVVAAGGVRYHLPGRMVLHDVLTAIRHGVTVGEAGDLLLPNARRHLQPIEDRTLAFASFPDVVRRTVEIADRCTFSLSELKYEYPTELAPDGVSPFEYLTHLTWDGASKKYPQGIPRKIRRLLEHELRLIEELHYEAYFLTVWDLVRFARERDILCQGRGSAANSAVCYCLGITSVDPETTDLLFERFVSKERDEAPDIDVDFEHERREEVIQYVYEKYGRERAGMTGVVITYRSRSAIRDVGKALGLSLDRVDALSKQIDGHAHEPNLARRCRQVGIDPDSEIGRRFIYLANELIGFPRHLSQHVGGLAITQGPLCELVPIENAAMEGRTVIEWDKDDLDELGILKVDCLALGMLTAIHKCFDLIREHDGRQLALDNVPKEDAKVYEMICRADTVGVFQIESRGQMSMLPRLKPKRFYDLVIEVAIVRPGPIQGNMVHPYLKRRAGEEQPTYPNDAIRKVLEKTLGVPIFQEQAMRLAVVAAGFTPGEADQLRRAMAAWRRPGLIDRFRQKLLDGMKANGLSREFAEAVYRQIQGFGEYGFPESHAASFARLAYISAWLKCYYPAAYGAALINSQPMGFYAPAQLVRDAKEHGVEVRPADVNYSDWDCTLEPELRLGLRMISGLSRKAAGRIQRARQDGPFRSVSDFGRRTKLSRRAIEKLANADAFSSMGVNRRTALWSALAQTARPESLPLLDALDDDDLTAELPVLRPEEEVVADYQTTGLSLRAHPVSFIRHRLDEMGVIRADRLPDVPNNHHVCVAGLVLLRQRPSTAKGITFVTLEDETGTANLVVHQRTWERFYQIAKRSSAWIVHGRLESKQSVIHVIVSRLEDLSRRIANLRVTSRNFR